MATTTRPNEQSKSGAPQQGGTFGEHAGKAVQEAKEAGAALVGQARDGAAAAIGAVQERAGEFASNVQERASQFASTAVEKADEAVSAAGRRIEQLADGIRENTPNDGMLGACSNKVADTLHASGKYLEDHGVTGMVDDLTDVIRRNPLPAVLVGVGIGFILARATSRG